jgi:LPS export ABC transporter protein LptC
MSREIVYVGLFFVILAVWTGCSGDTARIDALYEDADVEQETVTDVRILYSDSARVRLELKSPLLIRKMEDNKPVEYFPEGLYVEFFQGGYQPQTWLEADRGTRYPEEKRIILEGHVRLYNRKKDKLESSELTWDEEAQKIFTERFVRITQPEKGDTTYGFGFVSDQKFSRFEIKRRFSGKIEEAMIRDL